MRVANCVQASCAVVIYAALVFEPAARPGLRRRLRRRRTFAFGATGVGTFVRAILSATAFGGRPGPPGRHFPRALRRRRRPFFDFGFVPVETLPSNDWMAFPTSSCTRSRITVTKLLCLGIAPPFGYGNVCSTSVAIKKAPFGGTASSPIAPTAQRVQRKRGWLGRTARSGRQGRLRRSQG